MAVASQAAAGLPHDIRELLPYVYPWWVYALLLLAAIGILVGLVFAFLAWRRRPKKAVKVPMNPWEALHIRLKQLRPPANFAGKEQEDFFFELSMLAREAVELRTGLPATDLTWQELKEPLRQRLPLERREVEAVMSFLERADMIKFAGAPSTRAEADDCVGRLDHWITLLEPREAVPLPSDVSRQGGGA